jgi:transcriptional regulator with XRE-family HTH domain
MSKDVEKRGDNKMITFTLRDGLTTRIMIAETGNSLREFAKNACISHSYLSQILSGKRNPSPTIAHRIANNLNLKIEDIFLAESVDITTKSE